MQLTPRRRALIAVLVALPVGAAYLDVVWHLAVSLAQHSRRGSPACSSGVLRNVDRLNGCDFSGFHPGYAWLELLAATAAVAAAVYGLARWITWPIRAMATTVEQLGPNSLGVRLHRTGPRDETRQLADAIDAMVDRLSEGYEAQRRFASNASHELRTPLATQRALIEVSLSSALTPDQLDLLTRQLLATNERNERLVDGLLTLAETERGLMSAQPLRLDEITAQVIDVLRPAATASELALTAELQPTTVFGEEPLLDRLVTNLVSNAIKYNEPGGMVTVQVAAAGTLSVTNTGPVIPFERVAGLFEPFRRLTGERLDHGGGVGLGLTIARSIVAAHGGTIDARPRSGGGLVVTVQLRATA